MTQLGQYALEHLVAEGSTGQVYRARHVELGSAAAVKVLRTELRQDPVLVARFQQEARTLAGLEHPGIVRVLDTGVDDVGEDVWIALDWVDGAPLDDVLAARGPLSPQQAVAAVRMALQGLEEAHRRGVVHGDVSTGNVLLSVSGDSMLVDFGLACPMGASGVCGTPAFVSPEAAAGAALGPPSDVWSTAAVLQLLLTGTPVLPGKDVDTVLRRHREDDVPRLRGHGQHLAQVLATATAREPADRYPEAGAFLRALEQAAEHRFGAGWLAGAGLAGLASGVTAAAGGGATAAALAAPGITTTTGVVDTGAPSAASAPAATPPPAARPPRRRPRLPKKPVVTAGVVIAVAVLVPVLLKTTGSTKPVAVPTPVSRPSLGVLPSTGSTAPGAGDQGRQATAVTSQRTYLARLYCADGRPVQSATAVVPLAAGPTTIPLVFLGTDVWFGDLSKLGYDIDKGDTIEPSATCGDTAPDPQPDSYHLGALGADGPDAQGRVVSEAAQTQVCEFNAPLSELFFVHGFAPASAFNDTLTNFERSTQYGMTVTPMTRQPDGSFVLVSPALGEESAGDVPGKVYTTMTYGTCDFTKTPPRTGG